MRKIPWLLRASPPSADDVAREQSPGPAVTIHSEIDTLRQRIAKAEVDRDTWKAAGRQENYLEAYSMVEALEAQLDQLERTRRRLAAAVATPGPQ